MSVFHRLEAQVDRDGFACLLGLEVGTLLSLAGYAVMRVESDETREELAAVVEALRGAVGRELGGLAGRVALLEEELALALGADEDSLP